MQQDGVEDGGSGNVCCQNPNFSGGSCVAGERQYPRQSSTGVPPSSQYWAVKKSEETGNVMHMGRN